MEAKRLILLVFFILMVGVLSGNSAGNSASDYPKNRKHKHHPSNAWQLHWLSKDHQDDYSDIFEDDWSPLMKITSHAK
jgi:hypothetical protein